MIETKLTALRFGIVAGLGVLMGGCTAITVFRDGHALLPVIVTTEAAPEERAAAEELGRVLGKMSGLAWPVRPTARPGERGIYVGLNALTPPPGARLKVANDLLAPKRGETGPDAFQIQSRRGSVFIEGATPDATEFAVAWMLQNWGGVRWYAPGATGEVIPRRSRWVLPRLDVRRSPAYVSREIYGQGTADGTEWARHNGLRKHLEFNHALVDIFPPEILLEHPDWAPQLQGRRYHPTLADDHDWQPNISRPEVAAYAARIAAQAFAREPGRPSFSLAMNDTVRFDQSSATLPLVTPLRYFRGMPDYSPLVFTFMNRAAEPVATASPNHYLGCLAYFWCENPPTFRINPVVVPYVTTDRSQYYDSAYRAADLALMSRWAESGVKAFGLWEYAEGGGFLVPREPLSALAVAVREGWHHGARGYFAEVGTRRGFDAFKVWMLAQLLWEPDRSVEGLADDFYHGFYGVAAAPMRRFFERCEALWLMQPGPPYWLKFYQQEDQAGLFPSEVCGELRAILTQATQAARDDPVVAARVDQTSHAFVVTEAYVAFDEARRKLAAMAADETTDFQKEGKVVAESVRNLLQARTRLTEAYGVAQRGEDPATFRNDLGYFVRNDPVPRLLWLAGQKDVLAPGRIMAAAGSDAEKETCWRVLVEAMADGRLADAQNLARNPRFEKLALAGQEPAFLYPHSGKMPAEWQVEAMPTETGRVALLDSDTTAHTLRIEGAWDTQVFQWRPAGPGRIYAATSRMRGNSSPGNDAGLFMTFLSKEGKVVGTHRMQSLPKGLTPGWRSMALADLSPDGTAWVGVGVGASRQATGDWFEVSAVELRGVD